MKFRDDDYDDEDDLLQGMIELHWGKEELNIVDKEWHLVWMFRKVQKKNGMEQFQY